METVLVAIEDNPLLAISLRLLIISAVIGFGFSVAFMFSESASFPEFILVFVFGTIFLFFIQVLAVSAFVAITLLFGIESKDFTLGNIAAVIGIIGGLIAIYQFLKSR